eukprot:1195255-Prorocentrum_minimum.AAC.7
MEISECGLLRGFGRSVVRLLVNRLLGSRSSPVACSQGPSVRCKHLTAACLTDDRGGFTHDRGGFTHDRGGFTHGRGGFTHDRGGFTHDRGVDSRTAGVDSRTTGVDSRTTGVIRSGEDAQCEDVQSGRSGTQGLVSMYWAEEGCYGYGYGCYSRRRHPALSLKRGVTIAVTGVTHVDDILRSL